MTELRNVEADLSRFRMRVLVASIVVLLSFLTLAGRLVYLQVYRHADLNEQAENNSTTIVPVVPNRGLILDRNGIVLASNYSAYTLELTPARLGAALDRTIDELAQVIEIQPRDRRRFKKLMEETKSFESLPIRTKLTDEEVARFAAQRYRFPGVDIKARLFRSYPWGELASHVIGYIGRVNQTEKKAMEDWPDDEQDNYRGTEYIGKLGVEQAYEKQLHGITGVEQVETSASGRAMRLLASSPSTPGNTVMLSIDIKLQKLVEDLYGERRGAMVALDPKTGEVLAFVSKPTFDPNLFVDGIDSENWQALNESIDKPLLNRALRGTYPPGSTFKPYMALTALETGKRTPQQTIYDPGYFWFGGHKFRDDKEGGHGTVDMYKSIVASCDTYYYMLANDLGVDTIHDHLQHFGFGEITGIDIAGESRGLLPSTQWKHDAYKKREQQKWYAGETISLGIGQGYNNFTVLQMATAMATLANNGLRMKPHLVSQVVDIENGKTTHIAPEPAKQLSAKPENIAFVRKAMVGVNLEGTSSARVPRRPLYQRRQDRHRPGDRREGQRKIQRLAHRGATPRPCPVHRLRPGGRSQDRGGDGGRERRLRRFQRGADRAPGVRLLVERPLSERRRHGRRAAGQGDHADRQATQCRRSGMAAGRQRRGGGRSRIDAGFRAARAGACVSHRADLRALTRRGDLPRRRRDRPAAEDVAEQRPLLAVEFRQLRLLDRRMVVRTGIDHDAGQQQRQLQVPEALGLALDVFAAQVVAALLEDLHHRLRGDVAVHVARIVDVAFAVVARHERAPLEHGRVVLPLRIGGVLVVLHRDQAHRLVQARRRQHRTDRGAHVVQEVQRLPARVERLAHGLRRELGRRDVDERVGAG